MSETPKKIRVAISGGGLAGALMIRSLMGYDHLDVHIFESAPAFKEMGLAIGVTRNAFEALGLIGAARCLKNADPVVHHGARFMLAQGPEAGQLADAIDTTRESVPLTHIVHRAAFLRELLADVPPDRMHAAKKLTNVRKNADNSLTIGFADGSSHDCEILIGADGIHSYVRRIILGDSDRAANPVFAGWYGNAALRPYEEMLAVLGDRFVDKVDSREWIWMGDGTFMMHNVSNGGECVQFIWNIKIDEPQSSWCKIAPVTEIKHAFRDWPSHLQKALAIVLGDSETIDCRNMREHLPARTYADGPMCIIGDAAHTTTPWQASGGGTSIEDVLILSALLGHSESRDQAMKALEVYDEVRRPRTQRVVESSRQTGLAFTGRNPEYPLNLPGLRDKLHHRWDFILDFDNAKARDEAVETLLSRLRRVE